MQCSCFSWQQALCVTSLCSYRGGHITGVDVIRHLLPDILVFLTALATLIVNGYIVRKSRRSGRGDGETTITEEPVDVQEVTSEGNDQPVSQPYCCLLAQ